MAYNNCNQTCTKNVYKQGPEGFTSTNKYLSVETQTSTPITNTFTPIVFETIVDQGGSDVEIFPPDSLVYLSGEHVYLVTFTVRVNIDVAGPARFSAQIFMNGSPLQHSISEDSSTNLDSTTIEISNEILIPTSIDSKINLSVKNEGSSSLTLANATMTVVEII